MPAASEHHSTEGEGLWLWRQRQTDGQFVFLQIKIRAASGFHLGGRVRSISESNPRSQLRTCRQ